MNAPGPCPICGEGYVANRCEDADQTYRGHSAPVPMYFRSCDHCGSDFAGAQESLLNKRAMMAFRKRVDGLLPGEKIVALRDKYQITQAQAARLFGGGPVAFSKYENDDVAQSSAMDKLLRLVLANESAFWTLVDQNNMTAEFTTTVPLPTPASAQSDYRHKSYSVRVAARTPGKESSSVLYDPKEFRQFRVDTQKEADQ